MDPWQRWVLEEACAQRADGKWAAFEVGLVVPRQNGKGAVLEALELAALFLWGERLIVHSAHQFATAQEHFLRMQQLIEGCDDLADQLLPGGKGIVTANGKEAIRLKSGARLKFVARSKGAARGFTGDRIILDEAYDLPERAVGAMLPALSSRPNPQVWYTSSAPQSDSAVLHALRDRGIAGDERRLFFAEWGNEPGADPEDWDAIARGNPALGIRITPEFVEDEFRAMGHLGDEFLRERLGIPSAADSTAGVFGPGTWAACTDADSQIESGLTIALDVADAMAFSSFAAAGWRADGLLHGEVIERAPGTGWVVTAAQELTEHWGVPIALDPRSPAGGLVESLKEAGVDVVEVGDGEMPRACAALQEKVLDGTFRHLGQKPLDDAVAGAQIRPVGDAWRWSRTSSRVDISPLVAVTIAASRVGEQAPAEYLSFDELAGV